MLGEFEITGLIGQGGFGIVYLARDRVLDRAVALKEFMPTGIAEREEGVRVTVRSASHKATYEVGLRSFINEAKMLAKFSHPALVEVYRFWEANGTAYMAMRYYSGETLRQCLARGDTKFDEEFIAQTMAPIFDALEILHRDQVFHRDVAPDNIILANGRPVLLDFGSARSIIGDGTQTLTTILKPGYAPIEQYVSDGTTKQGPWTDVYALGGVLYHLATGKVPLQAVSRLLSDPLKSVNEITNQAFSPAFSDAVARAMAVRVENRLQNVREFSEMLGWNTSQPKPVLSMPVAAVNRPVYETPLQTQTPAQPQPQPISIRPVTQAPMTAAATHPIAAATTGSPATPVTTGASLGRMLDAGPSVPTSTAPTSSSQQPIFIIAGALVAVLALAGYWYWGSSGAPNTSAPLAAVTPASPVPAAPASEVSPSPANVTNSVQPKATGAVPVAKGGPVKSASVAAPSPSKDSTTLAAAATPASPLKSKPELTPAKPEPSRQTPSEMATELARANPVLPATVPARDAALPVSKPAEKVSVTPPPAQSATAPAPTLGTPGPGIPSLAIAAPGTTPVATPTPAPVKAAPSRADVKVVCPTQLAPEMPRKAIQEGAQGVVRAQALVRDGVVKEVTILSGPRVFHAAVRNAMLQYKCSGQESGEVLVTQEFTFSP